MFSVNLSLTSFEVIWFRLERSKGVQQCKCGIHFKLVKHDPLDRSVKKSGTKDKIKKFRILSGIVPLSLTPLLSQIVFITCCLVNFKEPLTK